MCRPPTHSQSGAARRWNSGVMALPWRSAWHIRRHCGHLNAAKVNTFLAAMRQPTKDAGGKIEKPGAPIQTTNHYARALKQFSRWMVRNERATEAKLAHLEMGRVATDRRYARRPLSLDEMTRIYNAAKGAKDTKNLATGPERALIYWLVWETGMRLKEVCTLTRDSFDLDGDKPSVS